MFAKSILFRDELDDEIEELFGDDDDYEAELERKLNQFWEDSLKKYNLKFSDVPAFFERYKKRLENYMKRIGCRCCHRITVSNALCDHLEKNEPDEEDYFFWQVCLFDSDFIFFGTDEDASFEKKTFYRWFFHLLDRMEWAEKNYINQKKAAAEYTRLMSEIVFLSEPVGEIDLGKVKAALLEYKFSGECFEDNLANLTDRICHSPALFKIAPLVYYAALMRYTKKMTDTQDYKMNFTAAFRRLEYSVKKDNGKNRDKLNEHRNLFLDLCEALCPDEENKYLCFAGFNAITNICECPLIYWWDMGMLRPLEIQLDESGFSGFPNGDNDNPCYIESMVSETDLMRYEEYDKMQPENKKFLGKMQKYIIENGIDDDRLCREYIALIDEGRTEECIPIVNEIVNGSKIDLGECNVRMQALLQAIAVKELMTCINEVTRSRLVGLMGRFDKLILK